MKWAIFVVGQLANVAPHLPHECMRSPASPIWKKCQLYLARIWSKLPQALNGPSWTVRSNLYLTGVLNICGFMTNSLLELCSLFHKKVVKQHRKFSQATVCYNIYCQRKWFVETFLVHASTKKFLVGVKGYYETFWTDVFCFPGAEINECWSFSKFRCSNILNTS